MTDQPQTTTAIELNDENVALAQMIAAAVAAERERIIRGIMDAADATPCLADANVLRGIALLVRANFSYERADELEAAEDAKQD